MKRVLFISSTGGHLNELLQLKPMFEKYDSYIITENTKSNLKLNAKVERVALENAASIAGLFLTTECVLVDKPEPAPAAPAAAPGMGGMM